MSFGTVNCEPLVRIYTNSKATLVYQKCNIPLEKCKEIDMTFFHYLPSFSSCLPGAVLVHNMEKFVSGLSSIEDVLHRYRSLSINV